VANAELTKLLGKGLKPNVLSAAVKKSRSPMTRSRPRWAADAQHAVAVGLLTPVKNLSGIYDLGPLNALLKAGRATTGEPMSLDQPRPRPRDSSRGASARSGAFPSGGPEGNGTSAIQMTGVSKAFGRGRSGVVALDRVSLSVVHG